MHAPKPCTTSHARLVAPQTDRAARIIANGLEAGKPEINFPWQMIALMKLAKWMPNWIFDPAVTAFTPTKPKKEIP